MTLLWSYRHDAPMELQTFRSYGASKITIAPQERNEAEVSNRSYSLHGILLLYLSKGIDYDICLAPFLPFFGFNYIGSMGKINVSVRKMVKKV